MTDLSDAVAETVRFNAQLEAQLAAMPRTETLPPPFVRQARREGKGVFPPPVWLDEATDHEIPGRAGPIRLRVLRPEGDVAGVYLHVHGGGWVLGAADLQDVPLRALARAANVAAVSVDYRLAPEHPFPAGPDDCEDAACWLVEHAQAEFGTDRLVIGGESAGAHLAALTLLRLRDRHGLGGAFGGANLVYGAFDLSGTPSTRRWGERNLVLSTPLITWFTERFLPGTTPEQRRDPEISPLYADLSGLPPALFTVGTLDPLLDDSLFMAARWEQAGNDAELRVFPESVHAFNAFPLAMTRLFDETTQAFVRDCVAAR
jgi:acetyl esterase